MSVYHANDCIYWTRNIDCSCGCAALEARAAKWDALSSGKPVEISPGITLESVPSPRPDPMERIAAACESIDKRLKSVISEAGGLVRVSS